MHHSIVIVLKCLKDKEFLRFVYWYIIKLIFYKLYQPSQDDILFSFLCVYIWDKFNLYQTMHWRLKIENWDQREESNFNFFYSNWTIFNFNFNTEFDTGFKLI